MRPNIGCERVHLNTIREPGDVDPVRCLRLTVDAVLRAVPVGVVLQVCGIAVELMSVRADVVGGRSNLVPRLSS